MLEQLECGLSPQITSQLNARKDEFQMMPEAATKALEMVKNPSCDIGLVARTIERDVKLAASILAVANSPIYSPGRPIAAVRDAVINVGFRQCQNLIQACCAKSLMQTVQIDPVSARDQLLNHSIATAAIAAALNEKLRLGYSGEEFTAGLLHDLGRLLMGALFPEQFAELDRIQSQETSASLPEEESLVGTDHCAVGCFFAITNRLPDQLAEAVRFHHTPERATLDPKLTATIAVADSLANHLVLGQGADCDLSLVPGMATLEANIGPDVVSRLSGILEAVLEQSAECVNAMSSPATV